MKQKQESAEKRREEKGWDLQTLFLELLTMAMEMEAFPALVVVVMAVMVLVYMTGKFVKELLLDPYRASRCF